MGLVLIVHASWRKFSTSLVCHGGLPYFFIGFSFALRTVAFWGFCSVLFSSCALCTHTSKCGGVSTQSASSKRNSHNRKNNIRAGPLQINETWKGRHAKVGAGDTKTTSSLSLFATKIAAFEIRDIVILQFVPESFFQLLLIIIWTAVTLASWSICQELVCKPVFLAKLLVSQSR